jgi:hypothetical protein
MSAHAHHFSSRSLAVVLAPALALPLAETVRAAETPAAIEAKARAVIGFALHATWPAQRFDDADSPLVIGVVGDDAFAAKLRELTDGMRIKDRPLLVQRVKMPKTMRACHTLFVSQSKSGSVESILRAVKRSGVLTVGEVPRFLNTGGVINFTRRGEYPQYRVSVAHAAAQGVELDAQLLEYAMSPKRLLEMLEP